MTAVAQWPVHGHAVELHGENAVADDGSAADEAMKILPGGCTDVGARRHADC